MTFDPGFAAVLDTASPPYAGALVLQEHQALTFHLANPLAFPDLAKLLAPAEARGLIKVECHVSSEGRATVRLTAGSAAAFGAAGQGITALFVTVRPKVTGVQMLHLAHEAGMLPAWRKDDTLIGEDGVSAFVEWTLAAFEQECRKLVILGGLRKAHERVQRSLKQKVRGRVNISQYMRNVLAGRPYDIPCEFSSLEADHALNRLLLRAILSCRALCQAASPALQQLDASFSVIERAMGGITRVNDPSRLLRACRRLPANMRHYGPALRLAQLILSRSQLTANAGEFESAGISLDMNVVYQTAFTKVLRALVPEAVPTAYWRIALRGLEDASQDFGYTSMQPDVWVPPCPGRSPIILDTKWKDVYDYPSDPEMILRDELAAVATVRSADLYQVTAYAAQCLSDLSKSGQNWKSCVAALVYPALKQVPGRGYRCAVSSAEIHVQLQAWDLSRPPREAIRDLWNNIVSAASPIAATEPVPLEH